MGRQMLLFGGSDQDPANDEPQQDIRILAWNLQSPSLERARKQTEWLLNSKANILLLTEATPTEGSYYLISSVESSGFEVFYSRPQGDKYFAAICVRGFSAQDLDLTIEFLPARLQGVRLATMIGEIDLVGMYAPTAWIGKSESYMKQRKVFHTQVLELLSRAKISSNLIVGGDLNVLEPDHNPPVPGLEDSSFYNRLVGMGLVDAFRMFYPIAREYSWYSGDRVGCRFDHFFVSNRLVKNIRKCNYEHEARFQKLSDHSAMWLELAQ